jgi:membrane-associated phospholipid phosphatase
VKTRKTAALVSVVLSPPLMVTALTGIVAYTEASLTSSFFAWWLISGLFLALLPATVIFLGTRKGWISDFGLSQREQRAWPLVFSIFFALVGGLVLYIIEAPQLLLAIATVNVAILSIALIISYFWKISFHTVSVSSAVTIAALSYGGLAILSPVFILLTGWSRVYLDKHSLSEVIAGSCLGSLVPLIFLPFVRIEQLFT